MKTEETKEKHVDYPKLSKVVSDIVAEGKRIIGLLNQAVNRNKIMV
jgi:hypothetical protein